MSQQLFSEDFFLFRQIKRKIFSGNTCPSHCLCMKTNILRDNYEQSIQLIRKFKKIVGLLCTRHQQKNIVIHRIFVSMVVY